MKKGYWKVVSASVIGPAHKACKTPCQDYSKYSTNGKNFVAIVSDGAGSAKHGKIGAKIACDLLVDILKNADFKNIKESITKGIEAVRDRILIHRYYKKNIMDFSATLVGFVSNNNKGIFFHIGDGAAIALKDNNIDKFTAGRPQNGLFSCETFFYTMSDWKDNLRFTEIEDYNTVVLMTDGVTNFTFSKTMDKLEKGFIAPINDFLANTATKAKADKALANTLNLPMAKKLNNDDKTMLWAYWRSKNGNC